MKIRIHDVVKRFGSHAAVDDVTFSVAPGEFFSILGPSGCGKTTLLRMIAGLETPSGGEIYIGGDRVDRDVPPRARGIAMVFQSYALYPHRTAFANITFQLEASHVPPDVMREKLRWAAEMFGITSLLDRYPRQLSGGERQRVALCRAVVRDPKVFLLDEPLANLDAKLRNLARDELKQLQQRLATTAIYVTHDQVEAMGLGDRIAVMSRGTVRQVGTPEEVYERPADTFVATFLGQPPMNLVRPAGAQSRAVLIGFRPEHFLPRAVFPPGDEVEPYRFHARRVEYLGSDRYVYGSLEGVEGGEGAIIAKLPATIRAPVPEGQVHEFAVPRRALHRFDAATGLRLDRDAG